VTIVTASVSALRYQTKPKALQDALLMGFVSFVGRTSFEVTIRLRSLEGDEVFLEGQFQMVALGKETGRPVAVNRLELRTDEERRIFEQGEKRSALAKESRQKSLLASESPPTPEETTLIHQLYLEARQYDGPKASDPALEHFSSLAVPSDIRFISDTWLDNTTLTQPQDRNVHFKVFGGHLMRLGYGLAWAVGSLFSRDTNNFLHFDEVVFRKPVEIGSMLVLGGQVTYVSPTRRSFLVTVSADILNPKTGERANSNHFHVIFTTRGTLQSDGTHLPIPRLLPKSYGESMSFIDGKRRWEAARRQAEVEGAEELDRW
jgi:acyl-coenzyme A thioesterase 9